jgi:phosphonate transport system substrate-binding protein
VWEKLLAEGKIDGKAVHVFYTTPGYYDYNWSVSSDMNPVMRKKLTEAFLALDKKDPQQKEILDLQRTNRFIPTKAENYKFIEEAARNAGLLK